MRKRINYAARYYWSKRWIASAFLADWSWTAALVWHADEWMKDDELSPEDIRALKDMAKTEGAGLAEVAKDITVKYLRQKDDMKKEGE